LFSARYSQIKASLTFTRKDDTIAQILKAISSLDQKINLVLPGQSTDAISNATDQQSERGLMQEELESGGASNLSQESLRPSPPYEPAQTDIKASAQNSPLLPSLKELEAPGQPTPSSRDSLLPWPAIEALLECRSVNLSEWDGEKRSVEKWLVDISEEFDAFLPLDGPTDIRFEDNAVLKLQPGQPVTLTRGYVEAISTVYFETFHCVYPVLDRSHFFSAILPQVCSESFIVANPASSLVLLVLSLGVLAQESVMGVPISDEAGWRTGVQGGSVKRPPGLDFLNAAKRRLGITLTDWSLDNLLSYILCA
jgi:hypothetical protein